MIDIVANHMNSNQDVSQNVPFSDPSSYHDCNGCPSDCNINNYEDIPEMEHCRLSGLMDLDQTDPNGPVATALLSWISDLVSTYNADGLRIDTVPYVTDAFWQRFEASAGVFCTGEVS